jgi:hypothetical protein
MAKTVVGMIENQAQAQKAVEDLLAAGFDRKDVGLVSPEEVVRESTAAMAGASAGMLVGGLAGMLLTAAVAAIPGVGQVLLAGTAAALLSGTALGAVAGGIIGGLMKRGVPEDDAHVFAEGIKRGATLVTVTARSDEMERKAVDIMKRHGAVDLEQRVAQWKNQGWTGRFAETPPASSGASPMTPAPQAAGAATGTPSDAPAGAPAKEAASGVSAAPGIAAVTVYGFEIIEPLVSKPYGGPERRMKSIPHEPERRMGAAPLRA